MKRTATARGTSGHFDLGDAVMVDIPGDDRIGRLAVTTEQALDLRKNGQRTLLWPALDFFGRDLQQGGQVLVAGDAKSSAKRTLGHAAINLYAELRDCFGLRPGRIWSENVGTELVARDPSSPLDRYAALRRNPAPVVPAGNRGRLDAEKLSESLLATCRLNCSIKG